MNLQSFNEPYRRHDWHSPEESDLPLLGVVTDAPSSRMEDQASSPTAEAKPSASKAGRESFEDRVAARIQHARMQGKGIVK